MTDRLGPMSFHDGSRVVTTVYDDRTYVRVTRADHLESGLPTFWTVYRSIRLGENSPLYQPVRELLAGTEPYGEPQTDEHEMWMGGEAVVTSYISRPDRS